jgi:hypothetical protein
MIGALADDSNLVSPDRKFNQSRGWHRRARGKRVNRVLKSSPNRARNDRICSLLAFLDFVLPGTYNNRT